MSPLSLLESLAARTGVPADADTYTTADVARLLGCQRGTVAYLIRRGQLRAEVTTPRIRRVPREALLSYLAALNTLSAA